MNRCRKPLVWGSRLLLVAGLLHGGVARAQGGIPDPLQDFLSSRQIFKGDRVLRVEADIDGDRVNEILLATETADENAKAGHVWRAYAADHSGGYRRLEGAAGNVSFNRDVAYAGWVPELDDYALLTFQPASAFVGGIHAIRRQGEGLREDRIREIESGDPEDIAFMDRYFSEESGLRTEVMPLSVLRDRGYRFLEPVDREEYYRKELEEYEDRTRGFGAPTGTRDGTPTSDPPEAIVAGKSNASAKRGELRPQQAVAAPGVGWARVERGASRWWSPAWAGLLAAILALLAAAGWRWPSRKYVR
jgi:hypothetical protein